MRSNDLSASIVLLLAVFATPFTLMAQVRGDGPPSPSAFAVVNICSPGANTGKPELTPLPETLADVLNFRNAMLNGPLTVQVGDWVLQPAPDSSLHEVYFLDGREDVIRIQEHLRSIPEGVVPIVYYSGHTEREWINGSRTLAAIANNGECIPVEDLFLHELSKRSVSCAVFDSCYSGFAASRSMERILEKVNPNRSSLTIYASSTHDQQSLSRPDVGGFFTEAFINKGFEVGFRKVGLSTPIFSFPAEDPIVIRSNLLEGGRDFYTDCKKLKEPNRD